MSRLPRVYMAGKVGHTDWRHSLIPRGVAWSGLRHVELRYERAADRIVLNQEPLTIDGFEYCGPYFLSDDHGCFHGQSQHGLIDPGYADGHCQADPGFPTKVERRTVMQSCLYWLSLADVVFCWLDARDAYGTLIELGYAHARGIPIFLAHDKSIQSDWQDFWFAREIASAHEPLYAVTGAWEEFTQWWAARGSFNPDRQRLWVVEAR